MENKSTAPKPSLESLNTRINDIQTLIMQIAKREAEGDVQALMRELQEKTIQRMKLYPTMAEQSGDAFDA